jgi:cobalt/nickel transport system permease protein
MGDALLSPAVSVLMTAVSVGAMGYSVVRMKREGKSDLIEPEDRKIPVMGVMGAFVFAAQMINFTIPATGSSGHIGGGILLAAMLGPYAAFLTLAVVLAIQCLFFADGGLLALGCNIFNMGFFACFVAYPLIFKPIAKNGLDAKRVGAASIASVAIGLELGAFSVVLETLASGVTELPFATFVTLMLPIHLAIGVVEGIITAAVLSFVMQTRPELLDVSDSDKAARKERKGSLSFQKTMVVLLILTVFVGGGLSLYASAYPDGLEWSMERVAGTAELERSGGAYEAASKVQGATAFLPDYDFESAKEGSFLGTSVSGIIGSALTLGLAAALGAAISASKKRGSKNGGA